MSTKIPKEITFFFQRELVVVDDLEVFPAFPKDPKTNCNVAINWASTYHKDNNCLIKNNLKSTVPNEPIYNVKIVDISYRGANSKVFKAIVYDKFIIDIASEFLLDVIQNGKIEDGVIKSPMIFVVNGKLSLMMVGGKYYSEIEFNSMKVITKTKLKPRYIYEDLKNHYYYFGEVEKLSISQETKWNSIKRVNEVISTTIYKSSTTLAIVVPKGKRPNLYKLNYNNIKNLDSYYPQDIKVKREIGPFDISHFKNYLSQFDSWEWKECYYYNQVSPSIVKFLNHTPSKSGQEFIDFFDSIPLNGKIVV